MVGLEDLVVSGQEMDKQLVAEILAPFVKLDKDSISIRPTGAWNGLNNDQKIIVYLIARKAMLALGFKIDNEPAKASEIVADTGVKRGTAHPALRKMLDKRLIEQSKDGKYYVPNWAIPSLNSVLGNKKTE